MIEINRGESKWNRKVVADKAMSKKAFSTNLVHIAIQIV